MRRGWSRLAAVCLALVLAAGLLTVPVSAEDKAIMSGGPELRAQSAVVMDVNSGAVLYEKDGTAACQPLSLTKLMTGLLALEKGTLTDLVSCSYQSIHNIGSNVTRIGLVPDERVTVLDLLNGMLVASADEAAYALGEHIGGTMDNFLAMMNERAAALGCEQTTFVNAYGSPKEGQTSSAYDLALIASEISRQTVFYQIAGARWAGIAATNKAEERVLAQTHAFIRKTKTYELATAGKTGGSENGRYSLCTYAEKDGLQLVAIVIGAPSNDSAYEETTLILNHCFDQYEAIPLRDAANALGTGVQPLFGSCPMFAPEANQLVYMDEFAGIVLPKGGDITQLTQTVEYSLPEELAHGENVIGHMNYYYKGKLAGRSRIFYFNPEHPISQEEFDAVWPFFLIPPALLGEDDGQPDEPEATPAPQAAKKAPVWKQPALQRSAVVFVALFAVCLTVIYVLPAISRRRRREKRKY